MTLDPALVEDPYELQKLMGFVIKDWSEGYAKFEQEIVPHLGNRYGIPHGGVYATLLDTAMGFAGSYTGDPERKNLAMTLSLTVNYLSQPQGKFLISEAWVTGGGRKTFFCDGVIKDETGVKIASGTATFRRRGV